MYACMLNLKVKQLYLALQSVKDELNLTVKVPCGTGRPSRQAAVDLGALQSPQPGSVQSQLQQHPRQPRRQLLPWKGLNITSMSTQVPRTLRRNGSDPRLLLTVSSI